MIKPLISNSSLSSHQQDVFCAIVGAIEDRVSNILNSGNINDYLFSLRGAAGTGKTYLTTEIVKYFKSKNDYANFGVTLTAPTHKAVGVLSSMLYKNNIQASCRTIHSFLGIKPFVDYERGIETFKVDKTKKIKESTSILIVDESSMVGSELFEYIVETIEDGRVGAVLFICDQFQLLPVDNSQNAIFLLKNQFELKEVVRQAKDSGIITMASRLREAIESQKFINLKDFFEQNRCKEVELFHNYNDFIEDFHKSENWFEEDKIVATYKNSDVDAFNRKLRSKLWEQKGELAPPTLLRGDKLRFKESYTVGDVTLYHNSQIVELESAISMYHESLGIFYWECKALNYTDQQSFRVVDPTSMGTFNDKLSAYANHAKRADFQDRAKFWRAFYGARDMFADVQYIHSSTIHKLQGSTYDASYVNLFSLTDNNYMSDDEKYRLTYVAITRARSNVKIFISKLKDTQRLDTLNTTAKFNEIDRMLGEIGVLG